MIASISSEILQTNIRLPSQRPLRVGIGRASAHHGEFLQGMFPEGGELHRGLLTLPMTRMESVVTFWPDRSPNIRTRPEGRNKAAAAARLALDTLGYHGDGGCITIESTIPVGHGYGSSTADVVASIRAILTASHSAFRESAICRLAVAAETASDAVIFGAQAVLFAQREGRVIEYLPGEYPPLHVVGFSSPRDGGVDTLEFPPADYDCDEIETFRVLRAAARRAIRTQDANLLGQVATASAHINQRYLPKDNLDEAFAISSEAGGCGVQVAHSGSLIGILIDATMPDAAARIERVLSKARDGGFINVVDFTVNVDGVAAGEGR
ncbi:kinase [Agrobacterium tumefaciens]|uniref:GHMP family kinase ATP-binding protein n=1 Tax=Agrobacterium tumefaciens TaxID=358 RepID=UPI00157244FC|nr:kinase [Agrobacterium tumefaciens]